MSENDNRPRPQEIMVLRVIYGVIAIGASSYLAGIYCLGIGRPTPVTAMDASSLWTLSVIHVCTALGCYAAAHALYRKKAGPGVIAGAAAVTGHAALEDRSMAALRTARILRLALVEGPAITGLTVCYLGVAGGQITAFPALWANALTYVILIVFVIFDYPRTDTLAREMAAMIRPGGQ